MGETFPIFEVPIIPSDLRQEETLYQIADCLDYLVNVTNTVFDCINARINENKNKIAVLQKRVSEAQVKVEKLSGVNKATQIFSTAKYPGSDIIKDYVSVFKGVPKLVYTPTFIGTLEKHIYRDMPAIEEKLQFFHVKSAKSKDESTNYQLENGLWKVPNDVESVSSFLLFNTNENPYKSNVCLDPMGISKMRKMIFDELPEQMQAAPFSISRQEQLEEQVKENYFYSPSLGDVPNIDAPLDLPDLPGIADDLRYNLDLDPGFAPSVLATPAVPDLPTLPEDSFKTILTEKDSAGLNQINHPATFIMVPPPPPPPPPPPELLSCSSDSAVNTLPSAPPPPPPPPPVPPQQEVQPGIENKPQQDPVVIHATSGDARANLMAAIRNAGGKAKLKPIRNGRDESKRIEEEKNLTSKNGDLMADLHNKLLMRRKGISGKVEQKSPAFSALDKVSAMIPPPALHEVSSATEDEDWEE